MASLPSAPGRGYPRLSPLLSVEAQRYFHDEFSRDARDGTDYPDPSDLDGWDRTNREALAARVGYNDDIRRRYPAAIVPSRIGGVPVVDIRPPGWIDDRKVLVYTHGGAFVGGAAHDALDSTLPIAIESGFRIVSVDYTLAPRARHDGIADEVIRVIAGLHEAGHLPGDIGVYGDSAGATIAATSVLQLRDRGHPLPAALVLWSPWTDLTCQGDSYATLADAEPFYRRDVLLEIAAACYAGEADRGHACISVANADFAPGYPPTLIQAGTREMLLSDSVRLHRALEDAGCQSTLDLYDGLWHVFQFKPIEMPEARRARAKTVEFLRRHLYA